MNRFENSSWGVLESPEVRNSLIIGTLIDVSDDIRGLSYGGGEQLFFISTHEVNGVTQSLFMKVDYGLGKTIWANSRS